jgi:hypothetical protein
MQTPIARPRAALAAARAIAIAVVFAASTAQAAGAPAAKPKAQHKHEHGAAKVSVAVDGNAIAVEAEIPGDGAFGFEHPPRDEQEKKAVETATTTLREHPETLFVFDPKLECKATKADVKSNAEEHGHSDVDADYTFTCKSSPTGTTFKLGLLKVFTRVHRVELQVLGETKQSGATITSPDQAVDL